MLFIQGKLNFVLALFPIFSFDIVDIVRKIMTTQYFIMQLIWLTCVQNLNIYYILNRIIHVDHEHY